ncbi:MAG: HEAT repeat domain-containing protein, partial [Thermoanaerobaculia bacterium]|nr:HEAT repeat domain-containing protein [Thermoanaerobaculia bacterium]
LLHESEMLARSTDDSPRQRAEEPRRFPIADLLAAGRAAADVDAAAEEDLVPRLSAADAGVRYWGCVGALVRGEPAVALLREPLRALLDDPSPAVRLTAAEALGRYGDAADLQRALRVLLAAASLETQDLAVAATALEAIDALDRRALALLDEVQRLPVEHPKVPWEQSARVPELVDRIVAELSPP